MPVRILYAPDTPVFNLQGILQKTSVPLDWKILDLLEPGVIPLGIVDGLWFVSITIEPSSIDLIASSPEGRNNGWYRALLSIDGTLTETRMLPNGNYDPSPQTNRPNMQRLFAAIPNRRENIRRRLNKAYKIGDETTLSSPLMEGE